MGRLENLTLIHGEVGLPLLRKDFILDPFQIYEARCAGADAIPADRRYSRTAPDDRLHSPGTGSGTGHPAGGP